MLGGFERDDGEKEREVLFGEGYCTRGRQLKPGGQGNTVCLDHTAAFPSVQDTVPCGVTVERR